MMNRGIKQIIYGIIAIGVTGIITLIGIGGNVAIVFYGAFIFGIILIIKGIINLIRDGIRVARSTR